MEHDAWTSSFEAVPVLCWKYLSSSIKADYWRALNPLRYTNKTKKILRNTEKYWARWGALFGVLCYFQGDEGHAGSQEWTAVQESMWVRVHFKTLMKPVFRHKEHTLTKISFFPQGPLGITGLGGKTGSLGPKVNTVWLAHEISFSTHSNWNTEQKETKQ